MQAIRMETRENNSKLKAIYVKAKPPRISWYNIKNTVQKELMKQIQENASKYKHMQENAIKYKQRQAFVRKCKQMWTRKKQIQAGTSIYTQIQTQIQKQMQANASKCSD